MKSFLIHGLYDAKTLGTLKNFGVKNLAFDLRARSGNLIPFHHLSQILKQAQAENIFLIFENDKKETVLSYMDLLGQAKKPILIFRDQQDPRYYNDLDHSFYWMFHPESKWEIILSLNQARGILLPIKYLNYYSNLPALWDLIDARGLDVFLHAESFEEAMTLESTVGLKLSIELTQEVETGFRNIDQEKLKKMKIWRTCESSSL